MKKILLMSFEYPTGKAYCGGVGQIVKQCREALIGLGYDVYVIITPEFQKKHPVKVLNPDGTLVQYATFWNFQKARPLHKFAFVIQHFVNWTRDLKKLKKRKGKRPRIIYHFHSILRRERDSGFKTFNRFMVNQEKMIKIADTIICPSLYEYDNFSRYFPAFASKVRVIENTIETFPVNNREIGRLKDHHELGERDVLSIYVGRLEHIKGAHILLKEIPKVLKKYRNHKIFIIGKALERRLYKRLLYLKKKYPKQLFYMRYVEKRKLYQYYYLCDIYINTSLSESFSLSAHESAFCGNALLLNELPVFDKFKDAALFFSNRESMGQGFVKRYREVTKSKELRTRLSRKATRVARDFSSHNRLKDDLAGLLEGL